MPRSQCTFRPVSRRRAPRGSRRAFTIIEILVVLTILAVTGSMVVDYAASSEAYARADRAARACVTAIRAARGLAVTSGNVCGVRFDTTARTFHVFTNNTPGTAATNALAGNGGTYVVSLSTTSNLSGVTMSVSLANDATSPYDLSFSSLGATGNKGTITFTYSGRTRTVTIPAVGDPTVN